MRDQHPSIKTGCGAGAAVPPPVYLAFSGALLALGELAREAGPQQFLHESLLILRRFIGFDSAWWGEVSPATGTRAPRNLMHSSIGLSPDFAQEWNQTVAASDGFARASMDRLGVVVREGGGAPPDVRQEMVAFVERHGLRTVMAITDELPGSGLLFFVCLYRNCAGTRSRFSDLESMLFHAFSRHLLQHWAYRLADMRAASKATSLASLAVSDMQGRLSFLGGGVGRLLGSACDNWQGTILPAKVVDGLARAPCSIALAGSRLLLDRSGPLAVLTLVDDATRASRVSPRELSAAMLYARGHSYKEIARLMGLTPATVRSYLKSAYGSLGVSNKIELLAALAP
ncbi:transcriptional regulator, LuxR family [Duganella sp. CF517]|uniref:helix-turn-helix transcriptional regulator n=1 Tax=Duganella sp. CF517 TaxID=1881038 RepID=UPI0008ABC22E|nr:helix-turn-helix transcriptional regulator [Duganella sp. CF517]SEN85888.1 transcriptional regulator, LuxR family [Duganella sp. CF517]